MKQRISQLDGNFNLIEVFSESINTVWVKYKIFVKEKKSVIEVVHNLTYLDTWDNIESSHFDVKDNLEIKF